jgi:serine/threonine protein kinase
VDERYEAYCLADPLFYDHPASREDFSPAFAHARRAAPAGWTAAGGGDWWHLLPTGRRLPDQGWKIHVSATPAGAVGVLDALWAHCVPAGLAFKFLRSPGLLFLRNSAYAAERGSAGKFATLYPADEAELERTLRRLGDVLAGRPGPYVLSDLRYGAGPLYVRYGGFAPRRCRGASGGPVPAVEDPRTGRLVPDERGPRFAPPAWVAVPGFLAPDLEAWRAAAAAVADLPYRIERTLRSSDAGGVHLAVDARTGRKVVLKQAHPHAGLLGDGRDAVAGLERERDVLRLAAGSGAGPEVLDWFELGEQRFLVLEFVEGRTLSALFSEGYPLIGRDPDPEAVRAYTAWALGIQAEVERAVAALHGRGVVFNDLHLFNIMVRPDGSVALIGFETAEPVPPVERAGRNGRGERREPAARAFRAPRELSGTDVDAYALACLRLALFLPLTGLLPLDRTRARALADAVRGEFPAVPGEFLDDAVGRIAAVGQGSLRGPAPRPGPGVDAPLARGDWAALRSSLAESIAACATPDRTDRLFPGDIRQFAHPGAGLGLAHGAAGVLYALHTTGAAYSDESEHWLLRRTDDPPPGMRLGFYDGAHGIAHVLDLLGHRDAARRLVDAALDAHWQRLGPDLAEGLAGVGLNLLHFAARTGDGALCAAAVEAGRLAVELLAQQDAARARAGDGGSGVGGRAGLLRGASGPALLFLHLYERTGDGDWLARARAALRMDLACCTVSARDGSLRVSEGWRALPYLAEGSAGIGMVLRRYLAHREDEEFRAAAVAIRRASVSRFYAQSGLFAGRAGMLLALADGEMWDRASASALASASPEPSPAHAVPGRSEAPGATGAAAGIGAVPFATPPPFGAAAPGAGAAPGLPPRRGVLPGPGTYPAARTRPPQPSGSLAGVPRGGRDALEQLRRLGWHAVGYRGQLAFPGDQLHRLSADLATGGAGVLLALGAVLGDGPAHLPFLGPPAARRPGGRPAGAAAPAATKSER